MLKRLSSRERIALLVETWEPLIQRAFLAAIMDIRGRMTLSLIVERLERRDVAGVIDAMQIEREAFGGLEVAVADAFNAGGITAAEDMLLRDPEGHRVSFRFGVRNPEAEAWLRQHSATMVTRIVEDQREAIRTSLAEGLTRGDNPRATALNIVGRLNRATGNREGGIIGITAAQERFVATARAELVSGDPAQLRHYLTRERRDRRFDKLIMRAISTEAALPRADADRLVSRYSDRLLSLRGELLARTETMFAIGKSRDEAIRQAIVSGKVDANFVTKHWRSASDDRVRHSHRALNGKSVGYYESFVTPWGNRLKFPGDPDAPISETSGCRCSLEYRVDYTGQFLRRRAA